MTRTPRLGAGGVVAAHDLAGAAAADALVGLAAAELGDEVALGAGEAGFGRDRFCLRRSGRDGRGRIGDGRQGEAGGDECEHGEQGRDAHDVLLGSYRPGHYSLSGAPLSIPLNNSPSISAAAARIAASNAKALA